MRAYFCRAPYESCLPCDATSRFGSVQIVEASDFVLANDAFEAKQLFVNCHQQRIAPEAVKVESRFEIDLVVLNTLLWDRDPKPVGDMALYDYWEWLVKIGSVAA